MIIKFECNFSNKNIDIGYYNNNKILEKDDYIMVINLVPSTSKRISKNTNNLINLRIRESTICNVNSYRTNENKTKDRIKELDQEWDIERIVETNAASMILISSLSFFIINRNKCFLITTFISLFLLQHAIQGWCPSLPMLRRLGIRTEQEIQNEKFTLKVLRGDFKNISSSAGTRHVLSMVEKH